MKTSRVKRDPRYGVTGRRWAVRRTLAIVMALLLLAAPGAAIGARPTQPYVPPGLHDGMLMLLALMGKSVSESGDVGWATGPLTNWVGDAEPSSASPDHGPAKAGGPEGVEGALVPAGYSWSGACLPQRAVAIHPSQRLVFFALSGGTQGFVCAYRIDPVAKALIPVPGSPFATGGTPPDELALDPSGAFLYAVASDDGGVNAFAIDAATGALTAIAGSPFATARNPHGVVVDPGGRFVYVATQAYKTAVSTVSAYAIDAITGALAPLPGSPFAVPDSAFALAIDPLGRYLYLTAKDGLQAYAIDAATGVPARAGAAVPGTGRIAVHPMGQFVYVVDSQYVAPNLVGGVRAYAVGPGGALTVAGDFVAVGSNPLDIAVSRSGRSVYVLNRNERADFSGWDYGIAGFNRDEITGALASSASSLVAVAAAKRIAGFNVLPSQSGWTAGEPMFYPLGVSGGYPPYAWSVAGGTMPPGLDVDAKLGALRGTPSTPGTYDFLAQVTDSRGASATKPYHFTVSGAASSAPATVVEFYHRDLDHYFITWVPDEIAKLDAGTVIKGWARTGETFNTYVGAQAGTSAVCRYYIPPGLGDSHFFGRGTTECTDTGRKNPSFVLESADFMQMFLPAAGVCPANTTPVYRVFSNRADANHRYMTKKSIRDEMVGKSWLAEGDGPDMVAMCAPQS